MNPVTSGSELLDLLSKSQSVHDTFAAEEINSLKKFKEIMGITCIEKNGDVVNNIKIKAISDNNSAQSVDPINKIGNKCGDKIPVWWHTHATTLSTMSSEDRLSAGNLKALLGNDLTCAIGIDGYSCHDVSRSPPAVIKRNWNDSFFKMMDEAFLLGGVIDLTDKWKLDVKKVSNMHQINCVTKDKSVFTCVGIDWDTGFRSFPIGAVNKVVLNGDVLAMPNFDEFRLQVDSIDKKLNCVVITPGNDGFKVLYCK